MCENKPDGSIIYVDEDEIAVKYLHPISFHSPLSVNSSFVPLWFKDVSHFCDTVKDKPQDFRWSHAIQSLSNFCGITTKYLILVTKSKIAR